MKVLDLQCDNGHTFEGWFASEQAFVAQCGQQMVQCPVCGDASVTKKLSAPRLHLNPGRSLAQADLPHATAVPESASATAAWLEMARRIVANTVDVGDQFAQEARKMHYGEAPERAIRGEPTLEQARSLLDEGIEVMPFAIAPALKGPLQ